MAVSDLWHRTLVYFGMADEADDYDDERYDDDRYDDNDRARPRPATARGARRPRGPGAQLPRAPERPPPRPAPARAGLRRHLRRGGAPRPAGPVRSVESRPAAGRGAPGRPEELQRRPADRRQVQGDDPGHPQPPERRDRPRQAADRLLQRAHLRPRRRHAARGRQGLHADARATSRCRPRSGPASWRRASSTSTDDVESTAGWPSRVSVVGAGAMGRALAAGLVRGPSGSRGAPGPRRRRPGGASRRPWRTWAAGRRPLEEAAAADLVCVAVKPRDAGPSAPRGRRRDGAAGARPPVGDRRLGPRPPGRGRAGRRAWRAPCPTWPCATAPGSWPWRPAASTRPARPSCRLPAPPGGGRPAARGPVRARHGARRQRPRPGRPGGRGARGGRRRRRPQPAPRRAR